MAENNPLGLGVDPELNNDKSHGKGSDEKYDGKAVDFIKFDPTQFELHVGYVYEGDDE